MASEREPVQKRGKATGRVLWHLADGLLANPLAAPRDRACSYARTLMTTRRFCARLSRVLLSAAGFSSP